MPTTRSSQRLLLLMASPRKALSSVSNILLDPDSHEAQQVVRRNKTTLAASRSSGAVLQLSNNQAANNFSTNDKKNINTDFKRGSDMHDLRNNPPTVIVSPSKYRHRLFTEVSHLSYVINNTHLIRSIRQIHNCYYISAIFLRKLLG